MNMCMVFAFALHHPTPAYVVVIPPPPFLPHGVVYLGEPTDFT